MRSLRRAPLKLNMRNAWSLHLSQTLTGERLRSMARCWMLRISSKPSASLRPGERSNAVNARKS